MFVTNEEKVISIGLIDGYAIMRRGLSMILHECYSKVRVTEAETVDEFENKDVDVILLGINSTTIRDCLVKAAAFKAAFPLQKLIVYDEKLELDLITGYFELGINGYMCKNSGEKEILECMENVLFGKFHLSSELTTTLLTQLTRNTPKVTMPNNLSRRESEIAVYLCQGMKTSAIARTLSRSPSTVSTIKNNILRKMDVSNVVELMTAMQKPALQMHRKW